MSSHQIGVIFFFVVLFAVARIECRKATKSNWMSLEAQKFQMEILDRLLDTKHYDKRMKPGCADHDGTCINFVGLKVKQITKINEANSAYTMDVEITQNWNDERLQFNRSIFPAGQLRLRSRARLWSPDLYVVNEAGGDVRHDQPTEFVSIDSSGEVTWRIRTTLTLFCQMDLRFYPFDQQICSIVFASYSYTIDELMLLWKARQPLLVSRRLFLQLFRLHSLDTTYYTVHTTSGEFTKLRANFVFARRVQPYVQQHYLPTGAFVLSSWAAFYLPPGHVTARLAPCLTALLGVLLYAIQSNDSLPKVPYGKSLDLWNCVCTLFVLSALVVVVFVNFLFQSYGHHSISAAKHRRHEYLVERIDLRNAIRLNEMRDSIEFQPEDYKEKAYQSWLSKMLHQEIRVDVVARIVYPLTFGLFNLIYWTH